MSYKVDVYLVGVEVRGGGIGVDWLFDIDVGGNSSHISHKIGAGSTAKINKLVASFSKKGSGTDSLPVSIDIEENDPVYQDYGSGSGSISYGLSPGIYYGIVNGGAQAVGPDSPASVTLLFYFKVNVAGSKSSTGGSTSVVPGTKQKYMTAAERLALKKEIIDNLKKEKKRLADELKHKAFGWNWDEILGLVVDIKKLEDTLDEFEDLNSEIVNSWEWDVAETVTEMSGVGSFSRIVWGKDLSSGEEMSAKERIGEAVLLGAGFVLMKKFAKEFRPTGSRSKSVIVKRKGKEAPEILEDIAPTLQRKRKSMDDASKVIDSPKVDGKVPRAKKAWKEYDTPGRPRDMQSQVWVEIDPKTDTATIFRATGAPGEAVDVSTAFKQKVKYSEYKDFIDKTFMPTRDPNRRWNGAHHGKWSPYSPKVKKSGK